MSENISTEEDSGHLNCLPRSPQLRCYNQTFPNDTGVPRLVCAARDGPERAAGMFTALVTLSAILVPLSVLLNLLVAITVIANRKLHTVINVLVTVLCANNILWTGFPVLAIRHISLPDMVMCFVMSSFFIIIRSISFTTIVIITVLRYLMVVRNRSYAVRGKSVFVFVSMTVLPSLVKYLIRVSHSSLPCHHLEAWSPDGFAIGYKSKNIDRLAVPIGVIEYGIGVVIHTYCYMSILVKLKKSKQRLQNSAIAGKRKAGDLIQAAQNEERKTLSRSRISEIMRGLRNQKKKRSGRTHPLPMPSHHSDSNHPSACEVVCRAERENRGCLHNTTAMTSAQVHVKQENRSNMPDDSHNTSDANTPDGVRFSAPRVLEKRKHLHIPACPISEANANVTKQGGSKTLSLDTPAVERIQMNTLGGQDVPDNPQFPESRPATSNDNALTLQPRKLLQIGKTVAGTISTSTVKPGCSVPLSSRPSKPRDRINMVTTVSLTALIIILFVTVLPFDLGRRLIVGYSKCVVMADQRILLVVILVASTGASAVLSPVVLMAFNADFRKAFWSTYSRVPRRVMAI